jgi:hypothetical protein
VFYCDSCHRNLNKLIDKSGENISYYCNNCNVETFPTEQIRSKSRLSTPDGPIEEPGVSYAPEIGLRKKKEVKGGLRAMQEKGYKITNYKEGKG